MTPTGRRSGRRDWLLCGVDIAAVLALLALSSRTGDPWWGLLAVGGAPSPPANSGSPSAAIPFPTHRNRHRPIKADHAGPVGCQ
jgi:hypothetical protein